MNTVPDPTIVERAIGRLNDRAVVVLAIARDEAVMLGHSYVGTEHLLIGLANDQESAAARVLSTLCLTSDMVRQHIRFIAGSRAPAVSHPEQLMLSPRLQQVIVTAEQEAVKRGQATIGTIHLLVGLAKERTGLAVALLNIPGVGLEPLGREIVQALRDGATD